MVKLPIGVSACLCGQLVRYDGGHRGDAWVSQVLASHFTLRTVCPEVAAGFGVPREPMTLLDGQLLTNHTRRNLTLPFLQWCEPAITQMTPLRGFLLKARSPSCDVHHGLFTRLLRHRFPNMPVANSEALAGAAERNGFIHQVVAYDRWLATGEG